MSSARHRRLDERLRRLRIPEDEGMRVLDLLVLFPLVFGAAITALHLLTRR